MSEKTLSRPGMHTYEVRPRKDKRGFDLISDALPFGWLWYSGPNATENAIRYGLHRSRSHDKSCILTSCVTDVIAAIRFRHLGCQLAAAAISRISRPFPCHRTSDGTRISSQIGRSFLFDLSRLSARCVPSPSRKSSSASIRHASVLRFVSLAFPPFHYSFSEQIA